VKFICNCSHLWWLDLEFFARSVCILCGIIQLLVHLLQLHIISLLISSLLSGHYWPMPHLFASLLLLALATPSARSPIVYGRRFQFFYPYQSIHHGYPSLLGIYRLCYCCCTISVDSLTILSISWSHVFRMSWVFFDLSTQCGV
jgi:hypothetical protein